MLKLIFDVGQPTRKQLIHQKSAPGTPQSPHRPGLLALPGPARTRGSSFSGEGGAGGGEAVVLLRQFSISGRKVIHQVRQRVIWQVSGVVRQGDLVQPRAASRESLACSSRHSSLAHQRSAKSSLDNNCSLEEEGRAGWAGLRSNILTVVKTAGGPSHARKEKLFYRTNNIFDGPSVASSLV